MKRTPIILFLSLFLMISVFSSQEKPTIAVFDFNEVNVEKDTGKIPADFFRTYIFRSGYFNLVSRENLDLILNEMKLQESGCTSEECLIQVGQILLAKKVLSGRIFKIESHYFVSINLMDVEKAQVDFSESARVENIAEIDRVCKAMTEQLISFLFSEDTYIDDSTLNLSQRNIREGKIKDVLGKRVVIDKGITSNIKEGNIVYFFKANEKSGVGMVKKVQKDTSEVQPLYTSGKKGIEKTDTYFLPQSPKSFEYLRNNQISLVLDTPGFLGINYELRRFPLKKAPMSLSFNFKAQPGKLNIFYGMHGNLYLGTVSLFAGLGWYTIDLRESEITNIYHDSVFQETVSDDRREMNTILTPYFGFSILFFPSKPITFDLGMGVYVSNAVYYKETYLDKYYVGGTLQDTYEYYEEDYYFPLRFSIKIGFQF